MVGDWNDVVPAVDAAVGRSEVAIETIDEDAADLKRFGLRTIFDEPGTLTIRRVPGPDPVRCTAEIKLGQFGDARREAAVVADIKLRLDQLRGRDYAPLPEDW